MAFVDNEKAFDVYMELMEEIYINCSMTVTYTKKATRKTSGEVYDIVIPYRPGFSPQHSDAYSYD